MIHWISGKDPKSDGLQPSKSQGLQPSINRDEAVEMLARLKTMMYLSEKGSNVVDRYARMDIEATPIFMEEMHTHALAINKVIQKAIPSLNSNTNECEKMKVRMVREGLMKKLDELAEANNLGQEYSSLNEQEYDNESFHSLSSSSSPLAEEVNTIDDYDGEAPSRKLFHTEEEEENRSLSSSADSYDERHSRLAENEQECDEVEVAAATGSNLLCCQNDAVGNDRASPRHPNPSPSLSLETNVDVRLHLQFVQDLNSAAPDLSNHIEKTIKNDSTFLRNLQRLNPSEPEESCFLFGNFDSCTPLIHSIISTMKSSGDLKSFLPFMSVYALVVATNMEVFAGVRRQMKQRAALIDAKANEIVTFNTRDPLSFAAKAFAEKEDENETSNGDSTVSLSPRDAAAVDAYNTFAGTDCDHLPSNCAVMNQKMKNFSSVALSIVMAVRVAKMIKISDVHSRKKRVDKERKQKLELLFILGRIIKPDLSDEDILNMTLHQYFVDVLYPTTDLSVEELFESISIGTDECQPLVSIIIQSSRFLKDELSDRKFIDVFKQAESCSLVDDMDALRPDEIQQRCDEMTDEDYYFCARDKNGKVLSYRRQPCGAILFSLPNAMLLGKTLKRVGLRENTIEVFLFGLLSNATSNFVLKIAKGGEKKIPLAFLFDETNYRRYEVDSNIEDVKDIIVDNIKPVLETAAVAIRDFEMETHFAEKSDVTSFTTYIDMIVQNSN